MFADADAITFVHTLQDAFSQDMTLLGRSVSHQLTLDLTWRPQGAFPLVISDKFLVADLLRLCYEMDASHSYGLRTSGGSDLTRGPVRNHHPLHSYSVLFLSRNVVYVPLASICCFHICPTRYCSFQCKFRQLSYLLLSKHRLCSVLIKLRSWLPEHCITLISQCCGSLPIFL